MMMNSDRRTLLSGLGGLGPLSGMASSATLASALTQPSETFDL
jgi:hypothetical protein